MEQSKFTINNGEILFKEDAIFIKDNAFFGMILEIVIYVFLILWSVSSLGKHIKTEDFSVYLYVAGIIGGLFILLLLNKLRFTFIKEIKKQDIEAVKHRTRFGNQFTDVVINNRIRRIHGSSHLIAEKIQAYTK